MAVSTRRSPAWLIHQTQAFQASTSSRFRSRTRGLFPFPTDSQNVSIDVVPPPSITAPASWSVIENSSTAFGPGQFTVADSYAPGATESLTLTVAHGTLTLSSYAGLTVTGNGTSSIMAIGLLSNLNAALSGSLPPPLGFSGTDSLAISVYIRSTTDRKLNRLNRRRCRPRRFRRHRLPT